MTRAKGRLTTVAVEIPRELLDASDRRMHSHWLRMAEECDPNTSTYSTYLGFAHEAEARIKERNA